MKTTQTKPQTRIERCPMEIPTETEEYECYRWGKPCRFPNERELCNDYREFESRRFTLKEKEE